MAETDFETREDVEAREAAQAAREAEKSAPEPAPTVVTSEEPTAHVSLQDEVVTTPGVDIDGNEIDVVLFDPESLGDVTEVAVSVPGLHTDVNGGVAVVEEEHQVPPDAESRSTLSDGRIAINGVETENGIERDPNIAQPEPRVPLDEHGRLVLSASPVEVPRSVADALRPLPSVKVTD